MDLPCVAPDIHAYLLYQYKNKEDKYAIGSIDRDRFIEVTESKKDIVLKTISFMNGTNTFDEIEEKVTADTGLTINSRKMYAILEKADLLQEENHPNAQKNEFERFGFKVIGIRIDKMKGIFDRLSRFVMPASLITVLLTVLSLVLFFLNNISITDFSLLGFQDHYIRNFILMFLVSSISISMHELSHGITAAKYGLAPKSISLTLYLYISPIFYIKLPGLYTVKPIQRIHIWFAGVMANAFIGCTGFIMALICKQLGASEHLIFTLNYVCYINFTYFIVNLCPLLPLDGYFILATIMKSPNLRKRSFSSVKDIFKSGKIKITVPQLIYFTLSMSMIAFLVLRELSAMIILFRKNLDGGISNAFWSIKQYLFLIVMFPIVRIFRKRIRKKR